jgi:CTP-dependent riboflavin kinase
MSGQAGPSAVELEGVASSGLGEGTRFTRLAWARTQFRAKLGFEPVDGTFNLHMQGEAWRRARERLDREPGIPIEPPPGSCAAKCFRVRLDGRVPGAAVFPEVAGYPADKLEVLAAESVRDALGVHDGQTVRLRLEF